MAARTTETGEKNTAWGKLLAAATNTQARKSESARGPLCMRGNHIESAAIDGKTKELTRWAGKS
jgi:hypothetical protein